MTATNYTPDATAACEQQLIDLRAANPGKTVASVCMVVSTISCGPVGDLTPEQVVASLEDQALVAPIRATIIQTLADDGWTMSHPIVADNGDGFIDHVVLMRKLVPAPKTGATEEETDALLEAAAQEFYDYTRSMLTQTLGRGLGHEAREHSGRNLLDTVSGLDMLFDETTLEEQKLTMPSRTEYFPYGKTYEGL